MSAPSIFACRDPRGAHWQLGSLPPGRGRAALIGWHDPAAQHEGGVPPRIAAVIARALTSAARVTFPSSVIAPAATADWSPSDGDEVRVLPGRSVRGRITARLRGLPSVVMLISTRQPASAMRLFDDPGFPWSLQGQLALLSRPDAPPPPIDERTLLALFGDDRASHTAGLEGILRPGVDGDVAGLWSLAESFEQTTLAALERETRAAGFDWAMVTEDVFAGRASGEKQSLS